MADAPAIVAPSLTSQTLANFGLGELTPIIEDYLRTGKTLDEFNLGLYDPSTVQGKIVNQRYPEIAKRAAAGLPAVSIAQVQDYKVQARQMISAEGLSPYISDAQISDWIVNDSSLVEQQNRLQAIQSDVRMAMSTDPQVQAELKGWTDYYGVAPTAKDLTALAVSPESLPQIEQQVRAVAIDRQAQQTGFGDLSKAQAEALGVNGVTDAQAQSGFQQLAGLGQVTSPLTGQQGDTVSKGDQIAAQFQGNAQDRRRIARAQAQAVGAFQGGGAFAGGQQGFAVGDAPNR